jgi:hypothetical protein
MQLSSPVEQRFIGPSHEASRMRLSGYAMPGAKRGAAPGVVLFLTIAEQKV